MRAPAFLTRFNPRLHPLLAAGIGLGVAALFLPAPAKLVERHTESEILARLVSPEPDLDHGPAFWLSEIQDDSPLWQEAHQRCREPRASSSPGCELLATLEPLVRSLDPSAATPLYEATP